MKEFRCPTCDNGIDKVDSRRFTSERVKGCDDLNADPLSDMNTLIELWYCCWCGNYFRVYYTLDKITPLSENL